jgi:predicted metal-dependent phosphoesterase TrpH
LTLLAAGLDFIASTEHNVAADYARWARAASGDLLVIRGQEVAT